MFRRRGGERGGREHVGRLRFNERVDLTRTFAAEQYARALESWAWIGLEDKAPLFTSPFGDVFFRGPDGLWWLDTLEGHLTQPWATPSDLQAVLNTPEGQDQYLLAGLAFAAERQGLVPLDAQVYGFKTPPVLGGAVEVDNVEVIDFVVCVNIAGQLHDQIRALPPGTRISGFTVDGDTP
jgi:hypothetical protein